MARREERPKRRRPPTQVEIDARRVTEFQGSMLDQLPDEALELAEEIADQVAIIQRGWDETTEWLRSIGVTGIPPGATAKAFVERLRQETLHRVPPFARIFSVDRAMFGYSYWLHTTVHVPPERYFWDELTLEEAAYNAKRKRRGFQFTLKVPSPRRPMQRRRRDAGK